MEAVVKMQPILALLLILLAAPLGMFLLHMVVHRFLLLLKPTTSGHASAIVTILSGNLLVLYLGWLFAFSHWVSTPFSLISGVLYTLIVYNGLGILYLDVLNISETSLHMHILLEIVWSDGLSSAALRERYSAENMVGARLERLTSIGQIYLKNDRYYLGNRTILYLSRALTLWRAILGLPLEPDKALLGDTQSMPVETTINEA